jgi:hypothetical protein
MIDELQARNAELEEEIAQIRTTSGTGNPTDAVDSFVTALKELSPEEQQAALASVADKLGLSDYDELGKLTEEQPSD